MKKHSFHGFLALVFLVSSVLFSGCRTVSRFDPYGVIIPDEAPLQAWQPADPPVEVTEEVEESTDAPRRRWFGRRNREDEDADDAEPDPVLSDAPEVELADPADLPDRYVLQAGDQLSIHITGSGLDEQLEMPVDENGEITLRFIGRIRAAGLSLSQLEREIELEYTERQRIFRQVFARVNVPYTFYFVGGEVRQPGRYPITGRVTLSQAIVSAGNFTEWARRDGRMTLVRNNERIVINFRDIVEDPSKDIELRTGDVITVERSFL